MISSDLAISILFMNTKDKIADILTRGSFTTPLWNPQNNRFCRQHLSIFCFLSRTRVIFSRLFYRCRRSDMKAGTQQRVPLVRLQCAQSECLQLPVVSRKVEARQLFLFGEEHLTPLQHVLKSDNELMNNGRRFRCRKQC